MAFNIVLSSIESFFVTKETTYGTAVTPGNADAVRIVPGARLDGVYGNLRRPAKTGTRSVTAGDRGRVYATFTVPIEMCGNGTAGTKCDATKIVAAGFGQDSVVVSGTSETFSLADTIPSLDFWDYRQTGAEQRAIVGAVIQSLVFEFGGDYGLITATGEGLSFLSDGYLSSVPTNSAAEKGGLTTFPSKPSAPVTNGSPAVGFTGQIMMDGSVIAEIQSGRITLTPGNQTKKNLFGSYTPSSVVGTNRAVTLEFTCDDSDSAALLNLKNKSKTKALITAVIQVGTVAGNIHTFTLTNVQLESPSTTDPEPNYQLSFSASNAYETTISSKTSLTYVIT